MDCRDRGLLDKFARGTSSIYGSPVRSQGLSKATHKIIEGCYGRWLHETADPQHLVGPPAKAFDEDSVNRCIGNVAVYILHCQLIDSLSPLQLDDHIHGRSIDTPIHPFRKTLSNTNCKCPT